MKKLIPVLTLIILLSSCKKSESDFMWEKSYDKGEALFIKASSDSGFSACGVSGGTPYFIRFDKKRSSILEFKSVNSGLFSSVWFDTSGYITGGNSGGKMLLMRYSSKGNKLWEKFLDGGFRIDYTRLFYTGNSDLLALGTASPDSSGSGATGLLFVRFDTTGLIITDKKITETNFVAANNAVLDNAGNIYLALTRKSAASKPKASVAKYNDLFQKLWESELYNNPDFGAACLAIRLDGSGNIYVAGDTEVSAKDGMLSTSFLASMTNSGSLRWKKYFENSNSGTALIFDDVNNLLMLNKNCFIINKAETDDGADAGKMRTFSLCSSEDTDAFGADLDINFEKNFILAGSRGGSFYLALKSSQ